MSDWINHGAVRSAIARNEMLDDLKFVEAKDGLGSLKRYHKKPHLFRRKGCWYCQWGALRTSGATPEEALRDLSIFMWWRHG